MVILISTHKILQERKSGMIMATLISLQDFGLRMSSLMFLLLAAILRETVFMINLPSSSEMNAMTWQ